MNTRQSIFVSEYLISLNATGAAIEAGYSQKTARSIGQRLLTNVDIKEKIQEHMEKVSKEAELTVSDIVKEIRAIARSANSDTVKLRALDMLMKHLGGYADLRININALSESELDKLCENLVTRLNDNDNENG